MIKVIKVLVLANLFVVIKNWIVDSFQIADYFRIMSGHIDSFSLSYEKIYEVSAIVLLLNVLEIDREDKIIVH